MIKNLLQTVITFVIINLTSEAGVGWNDHDDIRTGMIVTIQGKRLCSHIPAQVSFLGLLMCQSATILSTLAPFPQLGPQELELLAFIQ